MKANLFASVVAMVSLAGGACAAAEITYLEGHTEPVYAVAYSPDGRYLLSGSFDKTVKLWDRQSRAAVATLADHTDLVLCLAVSKNGRQLATSGLDKLIHLYEMPSGAATAELTGLSAEPKRVALSPDAKHLAVAVKGQGVKLYDAASFQLLRDLTSDDSGWLAFASDNATLWTATTSGQLRTWSAADGKMLAQLATGAANMTAAVKADQQTVAVAGNDGVLRLYRWPPLASRSIATAPVRDLVLAPDGSWVASATEDGRLRINVCNDGVEARAMVHPAPIHALAASADGSRLASGDRAGTLRIWNFADAALLGELPAHDGPVTSVAFHPQGSQLATAGEDGTVRLCRLPLGATGDVTIGSSPLTRLAVSHDGKLLAIGADDGTISLQSATDGSAVKSFVAGPGPLGPIVFVGSRQLIAVGADHRIRIHTIESGGALAIEGHAAAVDALALAPGDSVLAAAEHGGAIKLWRLADGVLVRDLTGQAGTVAGLAFLADGTQLLSAAGAKVRWWKIDDGSVAREVDLPAAATCLAISPDGSLLAAGGDDQRVRVLKAADGTLAATFEGQATGVSSAAFSADGKFLVTNANENILSIWDVARGRPLQRIAMAAASVRVAALPDGRFVAACQDGHLRTASVAIEQVLTGHQGAVTSVAYLPDGSHCISAGVDKTVRLWNLVDGSQARTFDGAAEAVYDVAVSPDGQWVAGACADRTLRLWKFADGSLAGQFAAEGALRSVAFSGDGTKLVAAGEDGAAQVYHVGLGTVTERYVAEGGAALVAIATSANGQLVAAGGASGQIHLWNSALVAARAAHQGAIHAVTLAAGGTQVVTGGEDHVVAVWNSADLAELVKLAGPTGPVRLVDSDPSGQFVAAADEANVHVWSLPQPRRVATIPQPAPVRAMRLSPGGKHVHTGDDSGTLRSYRVSDGLLVEQSAAHSATITDLALTADGRAVYSASVEPSVKRWQTIAAGPRTTLKGHESHVYGLAFSTDGTRLASAGADKVVKLWNTADGANYATATGHASQVYGVAFHPSQEQLASCGADKTLRIWNPADGKPLMEIKETIHEALYSLDYSHDGARLAAGGIAGAWYVWRSGETTPAQTLTAHTDHVYAVRFNAAGTRVATLGYAGNLRIWGGEPLAELYEEPLGVKAAYGLAYSPDGRELAVATVDHRVLVVRLPESAW